MRRSLAGAAALAAIGLGIIAHAAPGDGARERLRDRLAERRADRPAEARPALRPGGQTIAYGSEALQQLDVWRASGVTQPAPLVVFVHGGGWKRGSKDNATGRAMVPHYTGQGLVFASIDYRLVPAATVEHQAADVAQALKALLDRARPLGIDRSRVVLMGHSAGAHLVALVGTDEQYLRAAGLSFADIRGVIPLDGAAYDVPAQMSDGPRFMHDTYAQAFGSDPVRQRALSPTHQAAAPNAPAFLLMHVERADGERQAQVLAEALKRGGSAVEIARLPGQGLRGHGEINRRMGDPDYAGTPIVDAWLKKVLG
ncbi:MAG TPA: alpha/beta hydrolase [Novosphingobium sp.]|nr:alpha/beta hydrolase [Novosphingobium sp.]